MTEGRLLDGSHGDHLLFDGDAFSFVTLSFVLKSLQ